MIATASYRRDIDGLRSVAVLPVVLGHAGFSSFEGGFVGVDVFFVISGFLITNILARELAETRFSVLNFYERRARRILPALFAVLFVCFTAGWFALPPTQYEVLAKSAGSTVLFSSNIWLWWNSGDYFGADAAFDPLLHTWSLAVEEQFYLVFPLLLWALFHWRPRWLVPAIAILTALSFGFSVWTTQTTPVAAFYLPHNRAWELGLGALLALGAIPMLRSRVSREVVAGFGLVLILFSVFTLSKETVFPGINALPPSLGTAAIILAGMSGTTVVGRLLSTKLLVGIGLISYSLYLIHWPVLVAVRIAIDSAEISVIVAIAAIAISFVLAVASWRFIERPFRVGPSQKGMSKLVIWTFSVVGGVAILGFSLITVKTNGLPQRLPPELGLAYQDAIERAPLNRKCLAWLPGASVCNLGLESGDGPVDVIVWGDSHAGAMLPGIHDWLIARGLSGTAFAKVGCAPILGVERARKNDRGCAAHNTYVANYIEAQGEVGLVILAARWTLLTEGTRAPGEVGEIVQLAFIDDEKNTARSNADLVKFGLDSTLSRIAPYSDQILIMGGIPEIGFHVPNGLVSSAMLGRIIPTQPNQSTYNARNFRTYRILSEVAEQYGAVLVNPSDQFCTPLCQIMEGSQLIYSDDDHLSEFGAKRFIPVILESGLSR